MVTGQICSTPHQLGCALRRPAPKPTFDRSLPFQRRLMVWPDGLRSAGTDFRPRDHRRGHVDRIVNLWNRLCAPLHRHQVLNHLQPYCPFDSSNEKQSHQKEFMNPSKTLMLGAFVAGAMALTACSSMKVPATADVAVSQAAVENASGADATEFAPVEMQAARNKLTMAKQALASKDYKAASGFAIQAQADAKLAQAKARSAKAQAVSDTLQEDIRILQLELDRSSAQ